MVKQEIAKFIEKSIKKLQKQKKLPFFKIPKILVESPEEKSHGDYAANIALIIAKEVKRNPLEIAEVIKSKIQMPNVKSNPKSKCQKGFQIIEKVEVVEPGFINFFLTKEFFLNKLKQILKEKGRYGSSSAGKGKTMVIDYSSPNIAKAFGVGHLRSTIIGQALYNIYKFSGWKCIGNNHLGDWGTQYGKLTYQILKYKLEVKTEIEKTEILKSFTIEKLEELYVKFHKEAEKNPKMEEEARAWFKKLEQGDKEAKKIWQACVDISLKEFERTYKLLGVKIDYCLGESFYQDKSEEVINEAIKKKITLKSQGALIIKYPKDELPPSMLLKSNKTTTYLTRDLAAIKYRFKKWAPDLFIYEVGVDQILHLKQLFWAVELLGWAKRGQFVNVAHGLVRWKHGKFSTRRGETIHLEEILEQAIARAGEIIRKSETSKKLSQKEKEKIAVMVGIGAVKYNDLSQHYNKDIVFDWDKVLNLKGNSGPYLQYTITRCQSVLKKSPRTVLDQKKTRTVLDQFELEKEEEDILRTIYKFPEVVQNAAEKFSPNLICNFAFDLAQKYNLFYNFCPIIKAKTLERKEFRLALTYATSQILKNCLKLLGISIPEKM